MTSALARNKGTVQGLHRNPAFTQAVVVSGPVRTIYVGGQDAVNADGQIVGKGDIAALRGRDRLAGVAERDGDYSRPVRTGAHNVADPYARAVGHTGGHVGYVAWAGCLPEDGAVVVVLSNRVVENIGAMARPLVDAVRSRDAALRQAPKVSLPPGGLAVGARRSEVRHRQPRNCSGEITHANLASTCRSARSAVISCSCRRSASAT